MSTLHGVFAELKKTNSDDYEPDSLRVIFSAIDRHLNQRVTPNQSGRTIFFSLAAKFWKERPESYVLKVKGKEDNIVLKVLTLRKKKLYGNVDSLGLPHQNP